MYFYLYLIILYLHFFVILFYSKISTRDTHNPNPQGAYKKS
jgi:hypothetical protein